MVLILIPLAYPLLFLVLNLNAIVEADNRPDMSYILEKTLEQQLYRKGPTESEYVFATTLSEKIKTHTCIGRCPLVAT